MKPTLGGFIGFAWLVFTCAAPWVGVGLVLNCHWSWLVKVPAAMVLAVVGLATLLGSWNRMDPLRG